MTLDLRFSTSKLISRGWLSGQIMREKRSDGKRSHIQEGFGFMGHVYAVFMTNSHRSSWLADTVMTLACVLLKNCQCTKCSSSFSLLQVMDTIWKKWFRSVVWISSYTCAIHDGSDNNGKKYLPLIHFCNRRQETRNKKWRVHLEPNDWMSRWSSYITL